MNKISPINPLLPANQHQLCTLKNLCLQLLNHVVVTANLLALRFPWSVCLAGTSKQEILVAIRHLRSDLRPCGGLFEGIHMVLLSQGLKVFVAYVASSAALRPP